MTNSTETVREASAAPAPAAEAPVLRPGLTCCRVEQADKAAFLIDAAAYYVAARAAMLAARRSIVLLGWDFDPRVRLVPDSDPETLGALLARLVETRPELEVRVLRWDMPVPLAFNKYPKLALRLRDWRSGPRLRIRLDGTHVAGASHHQKLLIVDDSIAFCGGIDFGGNRWDRPGHPEDEPRRRGPDGARYPPRHDVMVAVAGPAAAALAAIARERWRHATGESLALGPAGRDCWPAGLPVDLAGVPVGIARTEPDWYSEPPVYENEALFLASIAAARRAIVLENQYFSSPLLTEALARRLAEPDGPEVVVINPARSPGRVERLVMDSARALMIERLKAADRYGRFRIYVPHNEAGTAIIIHSKVSIIDDMLLRIGTANVSNRSLGFDTECDIAVEAAPGAAGEATREAIRRFRNRLLAEHLGRPAAALEAALARHGGLIAALEDVGAGAGRLRPLPEYRLSTLTAWMARRQLFDPARTDDAWWLPPWRRRGAPRPRLQPI